MMDKMVFNEDIKKVFNCITNYQIISQYLFKDFISDIKIINENRKKEKTFENMQAEALFLNISSL